MVVSDLVRIAAAGGGLRIDCSNKMVADLVRLANAASMGGGYLILENTERMMVSDKIRIAVAGKGHVIFNDIG